MSRVSRNLTPFLPCPVPVHALTHSRGLIKVTLPPTDGGRLPGQGKSPGARQDPGQGALLLDARVAGRAARQLGHRPRRVLPEGARVGGRVRIAAARRLRPLPVHAQLPAAARQSGTALLRSI